MTSIEVTDERSFVLTDIEDFDERQMCWMFLKMFIEVILCWKKPATSIDHLDALIDGRHALKDQRRCRGVL